MYFPPALVARCQLACGERKEASLASCDPLRLSSPSELDSQPCSLAFHGAQSWHPEWLLADLCYGVSSSWILLPPALFFCPGETKNDSLLFRRERQVKLGRAEFIKWLCGQVLEVNPAVRCRDFIASWIWDSAPDKFMAFLRILLVFIHPLHRISLRCQLSSHAIMHL